MDRSGASSARGNLNRNTRVTKFAQTNCWPYRQGKQDLLGFQQVVLLATKMKSI